jgi:hypothetical protein
LPQFAERVRRRRFAVLQLLDTNKIEKAPIVEVMKQPAALMPDYAGKDI